MDMENPLNNPEQGRFKRMPGEGKNDQEKKELDEKFNQANERLKMEQEKKEERKQTENIEFLKQHPEIAEIIEEYEEKLGNHFTSQKEDIIMNLKEFMDGKTGVDMSDPKEKQAMEDTLKNKLVDEIHQRFNPAA